MLSIGTVVALLAAFTSAPAFAKTTKVDCTKSGNLQKTIDLAIAGDTVEITGICVGNYRIDGKDLTLTGAATAGPHGIKGVATDMPGLLISRSNSTVLQNLSFSNGAASGVNASDSFVSMSGCVISNNALTGIIAGNGSRVFCQECDLNGNLRRAALSANSSVVSLLDSVVTGNRGLLSLNYSYIDIDCLSYSTAHACSLNANFIAGHTFTGSTVAFYGAGDFSGAVEAYDRSEAQLPGARQLSTGVVSPTNSNPRHNIVSSGASLRVEPYDDGVNPVLPSRLMGTTDVSEFSHALFYGANTVLEGSLNCTSAGDAWVDPAVNLVTPGFSINGCENAP